MLLVNILISVLLFVGGTFAKSVTSRKIDAIGFSGSGFYIYYHFGVARKLLESGLIVPGETPMAGTSGGSYMAALNSMGVDVEDIKEAFDSTIKKCSERSCDGRLDNVASQILESLVPKGDAWKRSKDLVGVHITIGEEVPFTECVSLPPTGLTVTGFTSRNDLISALRASSFVSGISKSDTCTTTFRDMYARDGGYSKELPCPDGFEGDNCLRVAVVPSSQWVTWSGLGGDVPLDNSTDIYPGIRGLDTLPISEGEWLKAMFNAEAIALHKYALVQLGYEDTEFWLDQNSRPRK
ncbi:hypothetical protein SARC_05661 [Sphaeroforma arctica JP610]|uniref:PNPLA domain-containing protein n=1 Tax=Sphaeroforma arctica JP610 TaxID=667725 RepID=A0A0L0FZJ0_9EUKA|nr:hypothetical protein SARC_05661 [Sphaeroforma arctica JP610]KNC82044.1 hypothetical protein SARC_05661 [Sphaeroforma arctica JP610]|eukprot:XP_014155946.1 hypothetical protein SARC_05661 [Sphaeroforma arctica JP610]